MRNYDLEIREAFDEKYLKVFLRDLDRIQEIQALIQQLPSVNRANITKSSSKSSPHENLTVYRSRVYSTEEMASEVETALELYFSGGTYDPVFVDRTIPSLSDEAYFRILDYILSIGRNLERYPRVTGQLDEEGLRDYFLPFLNTVSKNHSAAGEAFNRRGRTDILVQDVEGNNVFIAECKLWRGGTKLTEAINQLLERYVSWRDEKVAIVVFNKNVAAFSGLIESAVHAVREHPNFVEFIGQRDETSFSFIF